MATDVKLALNRRTGPERRQPRDYYEGDERRDDDRRQNDPEDITFIDPSSFDGIHTWLSKHCTGEWSIVSDMPTLSSHSTIISFDNPEDYAKFTESVQKLDER